MNGYPKTGDKIITNETLGRATGMLIRQDYLDARREGARGVVGAPVGGHGGDVWWVHHSDATAAYCIDEFELLGGHNETAS